MIEILIFLFSLFSLGANELTSNCELTSKQIERSIIVLVDKKIIETNNIDTLYLKVSEDFSLETKLLTEININKKKFYINYSKNGFPRIYIKSINDSIRKDDRKMISFSSKNYRGKTYKGDIVFDCIDGRMIFIDCYCYSFVH